MSFDTLDLLESNVFQVTWDLGRRCNYDCSYCPSHRHDNFSPHASLTSLKKTYDFILNYSALYNEHRYVKEARINFTGGEPTVNPDFIELSQYIRQEYQERYADKFHCAFTLTTNGAMGKKTAQEVLNNFNHVTISYHTEAEPPVKEQIKRRILQFKQEKTPYNLTISVNVMFHAAYFDECVEMCQWLSDNHIEFVPRVIGEEPDSRSNFAHQYTKDQITWLQNYWNNNTKKFNKPDENEVAHNNSQASQDKRPEPKKLGLSIGRPCCGSRTMSLTHEGEERKSRFVDFRNFKGWYCSVNWFFLHLEQQTDRIYHHQTCQARFDQTRGAIGKISEGDLVLKQLKKNLEAQQMPTIICPKETCGCGLCAPKSAYKENYKDVLFRHVQPNIFQNSMNEETLHPPIIPEKFHE